MGAPPPMVATLVTRYVDTVDVAGITFRISCRYPKPGFWARSRREFLTARAPDVVVAMTYDDDFPRRGGDTLSDAPRVRRQGRALRLTTAYYRAIADLGRGRATVRIAAGFGVANLMRTLAALWLLERGTLLLRAVRLGRDGATLACGIPEEALGIARRATVTGYLAVTPGASGVITRLTPFLEGDGPLPARREVRARTLWLPGSGGGAQPVGMARALGVLLPAIWQADRRRAALVQTLDLATRVVAVLRCFEIGARGEVNAALG
jgi:hypothetical protein